MEVLSVPFRLHVPGSFKKTEYGSDQYKAEQIAAFIRTHSGERLIYKDFGIDDPTFDDFDEADFASAFSDFYPDIVIATIEVEEEKGAISNIRIEFE